MVQSSGSAAVYVSAQGGRPLPTGPVTHHPKPKPQPPNLEECAEFFARRDRANGITRGVKACRNCHAHPAATGGLCDDCWTVAESYTPAPPAAPTTSGASTPTPPGPSMPGDGAKDAQDRILSREAAAPARHEPAAPCAPDTPVPTGSPRRHESAREAAKHRDPVGTHPQPTEGDIRPKNLPTNVTSHSLDRMLGDLAAYAHALRRSITDLEALLAVIDRHLADAHPTPVASPPPAPTPETGARNLRAIPGPDGRRTNGGNNRVPNDQEVAARYLAGETTAQLATAFGVGKSGITACLRRTGTRKGAKRTETVDHAAIERRYTDGQSCNQIAATLGYATSTVQRSVRNNPRLIQRDDRATRSGGRTAEDTPNLVEWVVAMYVDEDMRIDETAHAAGLGYARTTRILRAAGVTIRPSEARNPADRASGLRERIEQLGTTTPAIRAWAATAGVQCPPVGTVPTAVVDAWETAHQPTGEPA